MASPGRAGQKKALSPHNAAGPPAKFVKLEPASTAKCGTLDSSDDDCSWGPSQPAEAGAGPLTQLAAAGSGQVAQAFCPHCSCFLPDVGGGGASAGAAHVAACGESARRAGEADGEDSESNWSEAEETGVGAEGLQQEVGDPTEERFEEELRLDEQEGDLAEEEEERKEERGRARAAAAGLQRTNPSARRQHATRLAFANIAVLLTALSHPRAATSPPNFARPCIDIYA